MIWRVTIYRVDSQSPVVYENVKHAWTEGAIYIVSQFSGAYQDGDKRHHYWKWPWRLISHVKEERAAATPPTNDTAPGGRTP